MISACSKNEGNEMTISVIIPIYNVEKYLNKCIKSVVNQTYKNLEIILVNDGSTDCSPTICDEWAKKDNRIKVIHRKNSGVSATRNAGIDVATGEYICFVDSDDYVADNYVEELYKSIISNNADLAMCGCINVNEDYKSIPEKSLRTRVTDRITTGKELLKDLVYEEFMSVVPWSKIYKRRLFTDLRFKEGKIHEDEFIIHHLLSECNVINCISKPLYCYLIHDNSIMGKGFNIERIDFLEALQDRINLFERNGQDEFLYKTIMKLLNTSISFYKNIKKPNNLKPEESKLFFQKVKEYFIKYSKKILFSRCIDSKSKLRILRYFIEIKMSKYNYM